MATTDRDTVETTHPLSHHLGELRKRVVYIAVFWFIIFGLCYWQNTYIKNFVTAPVEPYVKAGTVVIVTLKPLEAFLASLTMSMLAALVLSMPFILYQMWKFVAPGLYKEERKYLLGFVLSASILFLAGAAFVYNFVFPLGFKFFASFAEKWDIKNTWSITLYMNLILKLIIAFGTVFELPVVIFFLAKIGLITADTLRKYRKFAIIGIFILAAVLTPPDVISQIMMAIPLLILYEISIFIAHIFGKKKESVEKNETGDIYQ